MGKMEFLGCRGSSDPIAPEIFLHAITDWTKDGLPFVLYIGSAGQLWAFAYDQATIDESDVPFADVDITNPCGGGLVKYYRFNLHATGHKYKERTYECFIQRDGMNIKKTGWINTPQPPSFMWRPWPIGDLTDKATWTYRCDRSNPKIDLQIVYEIYSKSLRS